MNLTGLCILLATSLGTAVAADEEDPPLEVSESMTAPRARVMYTNFLALRINPSGLVEQVGFSYRHRFFESNHPLFEDAWIDVGPTITLAPTFGAGGVRVEVRPLAILSFSATYEFIGYFGVLNTITPFASTSSNYWESTIRRRGQAGENYAAMGSRTTLEALVQAKVGPVFVRNNVTLMSFNVDMRDGDRLFYDANLDLLVADAGWNLVDDLDLGVVVNRDRTAIGIRYSYADALHGTGGDGDTPMHRVGPIVAHTFHERAPGARFNKPTLLTLLQWYPSHVYRAGTERPAAFPLIALALQFEGDLWISDR